jgi:asparagine N-glycosylation enzyme membrane subunit Stt3
MFSGQLPILLKDMFNQNNRVYNEVLKYIWKIDHMKVTLWKNSSTNKTKYTVKNSDILVDENTHFIIKDYELSDGRKYKRVGIDNDGATVIDDEIDDNEQSGGKRKTKSRKSKKSSPKRKRRTYRK